DGTDPPHFWAPDPCPHGAARPGGGTATSIPAGLSGDNHLWRGGLRKSVSGEWAALDGRESCVPHGRDCIMQVGVVGARGGKEGWNRSATCPVRRPAFRRELLFACVLSGI